MDASEADIGLRRSACVFREAEKLMFEISRNDRVRPAG
jgi:hypothetical protein